MALALQHQDGSSHGRSRGRPQVLDPVSFAIIISCGFFSGIFQHNYDYFAIIGPCDYWHFNLVQLVASCNGINSIKFENRLK